MACLKIISVNVNSLVGLAKRNELLSFIQKHDPDVVLVCETKLSNRYRIQFADYKLIRSDRQATSSGGGTAVLVKNSILHEVIFSPSSRENSVIEYTIISVRLNDKKLFLAAIYANNSERVKFRDELNALFLKLKLQDPNHLYLFAGDFNARHKAWGDKVNKRKGIILNNWLQNEGLGYRARILTTDRPSFPSAGSFLDLCLCDHRVEFTDLVNNKIRALDYCSDHRALLFNMKLQDHLSICRTVPEETFRFAYKKTKWKKFTKKLAAEYQNEIPTNRNLTIDEINQHIKSIEQTIIKTIHDTVPRYTPHNNVLNYVNSKIKRLHKYKSFIITALNKSYKNTQPSLYQTPFLKELIQRINYILKLNFSTSYIKYWETQVKSIDYKNSASFFPKVNRFFRPKEPIKINSLKIPRTEERLIADSACDVDDLPIRGDSLVAEAPVDVLNFLGAFYQRVNSPNFINSGTDLKREVDGVADDLISSFSDEVASGVTLTTFSDANPANAPSDIDFAIPFMNQLDAAKIFKSLPNKTSSGLDDIPPIILKHLPANITRDYTTIFNNCLNRMHFPNSWKTAKLLPILKKNKPPDAVSSYRPISLTPAVSKAYERWINFIILHHTNKLSVISNLQFGSVHKLSTVHAIHKIMNDALRHLDKGEIVGACLVDIQRAYDSVWINGLLYLLWKLGFPRGLIRMIWSMTQDRKFRTWDGEYFSSKFFEITEGLMQGTVNSPLLFIIFTFNIPHLFGLNSGNATYSASFVDDFVFLVADKNPAVVQEKMEILANKISDHYKNWNLLPNVSKYEVFLCHRPLNTMGSNKRNVIKNFHIQITDNDREHVIHAQKNVTYLGFKFDYLMRSNDHVLNQLEKAKKVFRKHSNLFFSKSLAHRAKIICYLLLIRPIITYAAPIWWNISACVMEKLRRFERQCLRAALHMYRKNEQKHFCSNGALYDRAGIPRIDNFIVRLCRDYFANLRDIPNRTVQKFSSYDEPECRARASTNYLAPQSFMYFDAIKMIQNDENVPIIYHFPRHRSNKRICFNQPGDPPAFKYSMAIPNVDHQDAYKFRKKYWWLALDERLRDEFRKRRKKKRNE